MEIALSSTSPGEQLAAISNEMVRLYKQHFGRGPTKVRTNWAGPDAIICLLENSLTPVERSLVRMERQEELRNIRMAFQYATEPEFRRIVEELTGRTVRSFISGIDVGTDVSAELFVLDPL